MKFYNQEIQLRKILKYPPFCDIIKIEVSDFDEKTAQGVVNAIYDNLLKMNCPNMQVYSPMPSPINKIKNRYRWRIIIKCKLGNSIINKINLSINTVKINNNTRVGVDINPNSMT